MKFAYIILSVGLNPKLYPTLAKTPIVLYDRKNRIVEEELPFSHPIFWDSPDSLIEFMSFLDEYEKKKTLSSFEVKLDEFLLSVHIKGIKPMIFLRTK